MRPIAFAVAAWLLVAALSILDEPEPFPDLHDESATAGAVDLAPRSADPADRPVTRPEPPE